MASTHADDPELVAAEARHRRLSASPGAIATILRMAADIDVRDVLGAIHVPVLIFNMPSAREEASYGVSFSVNHAGGRALKRLNRQIPRIPGRVAASYPALSAS